MSHVWMGMIKSMYERSFYYASGTFGNRVRAGAKLGRDI